MEAIIKDEAPPPVNPFMQRALLILNCAILAFGCCGAPLVARLYFLHGGNRVWLSSWLQTAGWPILLIPLVIIYLFDYSKNADTKLIKIEFPVFLAAAGIGILAGFDDYFYAYGLARLPVSTSALIIATQLIFTAGFAFLLVKQRFTPYSINAIVLLTVASGVLALNTSNDRPEGESNKQYILGFVMTLAAAALYGLMLPLVELTYKKARQEITYTLVLEIQTIVSFTATVVCTVGMLINNDFKAISREAREFGLGETKYYVVLVFSAILWQLFFLGALGVVFVASSLLSGVLISVLLPVTEVLAVIFYHESFKGEKGVSLALSLWGFISYFYGEARQSKKQKQKATPGTRSETETRNGTDIQNGTEMSTRSPHLVAEV